MESSEMNRYTYDTFSDIEGELYHSLLVLAMQFVRLGGFVVRSQGETINQVLEEFLPYFVEDSLQTDWPGTQLTTSQERVTTFELNPVTLELLQQKSNSIFSWILPDLPEDLFLLREDGTPWMGSVAHEGYIFFELTEDESRIFFDAFPSLKNRLCKYNS